MSDLPIHFPDPRKNKDGNGGELPWMAAPSIYDHIARNIEPETGKLRTAGKNLPDDERRFPAGGLRWAPGALDGVFGSQLEPEEAAGLVAEIGRYILQIAAGDSIDVRRNLYNLLVEEDVLGFIDQALMEIRTIVVHPSAELHDFALMLARMAPDRGPVKFAIALLGILGDQEDAELVSVLGRHDEFTLYSVVAISNLLPDPERELWELAKRVDGWGRIQVVERLASTNSSAIKDWLLREGYRNSIMNEYLAYDCAVAGDLHAALSAEDVDDELLLAAGEILDALLVGGPAKDIGDYADAAEVILRYLDLLRTRAGEIQQYLVTDSILGYLTDDWQAERTVQGGWSFEARDRAIALANQILEKPFWKERVRRDLNSDDPVIFFHAARAAEMLGIETWDTHLNRLYMKPMEASRWYSLMQGVNGERIDLAVNLAMKLLPLGQVATGASNKLGFGPDYLVHQCLDFVVQGLQPFPGKGWPLLAASLKSPVTRNRNMALNVLSQWGKDNWPEDAEAALIAAAQVEPAEATRERMMLILAGGESRAQ